jgi:hypothetical protein
LALLENRFGKTPIAIKISAVSTGFLVGTPRNGFIRVSIDLQLLEDTLEVPADFTSGLAEVDSGSRVKVEGSDDPFKLLLLGVILTGPLQGGVFTLHPQAEHCTLVLLQGRLEHCCPL